MSLLAKMDAAMAAKDETMKKIIILLTAIFCQHQQVVRSNTRPMIVCHAVLMMPRYEARQ